MLPKKQKTKSRRSNLNQSLNLGVHIILRITILEVSTAGLAAQDRFKRSTFVSNFLESKQHETAVFDPFKEFSKLGNLERTGARKIGAVTFKVKESVPNWEFGNLEGKFENFNFERSKRPLPVRWSVSR